VVYFLRHSVDCVFVSLIICFVFLLFIFSFIFSFENNPFYLKAGCHRKQLNLGYILSGFMLSFFVSDDLYFINLVFINLSFVSA